MQLKADSMQLKVYSMQLKADSMQLKVYSMQLKVYSMQLKVYSMQLKVYSMQLKGLLHATEGLLHVTEGRLLQPNANLHSFHDWPVAWQPLLSASLTLLEVSQSPVYENIPTYPDPRYTYTMTTHQPIQKIVAPVVTGPPPPFI